MFPSELAKEAFYSGYQEVLEKASLFGWLTKRKDADPSKPSTLRQAQKSQHLSKTEQAKSIKRHSKNTYGAKKKAIK